MFKAILIDDEAHARNTLSILLNEHCPEIEILDKCDNVPSAVIKINQLKPDIVFCDIEMPEYSGFDLLSFFKDIDFELVFVTAFSQYAVSAFEVSAMDYLLKPLEIEKLLSCVEKLKKKTLKEYREERLNTLKSNFEQEKIVKIALPVQEGLLFIYVRDIMNLEADGAYTNVHLQNDKEILVSKKIRFFESLLAPYDQFFRVHRSSIINLNYVSKYLRGESVLEMENGKFIKIARDRKNFFEEKIRGIKL